MSKALIFDMDGTIANLYAVDGWLEKLHASDASPYSDALPLYDMNTLKAILQVFQNMDYRVVVVSWGAMNATNEYMKAIRKAKLEWLKRYDFPYDEIHIVKYGTPKHNFIKDDLSILIDDDDKVRTSFMKSTRAGEKRALDAKLNILKQLIDILVD